MITEACEKDHSATILRQRVIKINLIYKNTANRITMWCNKKQFSV